MSIVQREVDDQNLKLNRSSQMDGSSFNNFQIQSKSQQIICQSQIFNSKKLKISNKQLFRFVFVLFVIVAFSIFMYSKSLNGNSQDQLRVRNARQLITSYKSINNYEAKDFYWFSVSIKDLILNSDLQSLYRRDRQVYSVNKNLHFRALLLTQLIHNINFEGKIQVQLSPFDESLQQKKKVIQNLLQLERKYYEEKYQISKYKQELRFCVLVPNYNNFKSKLYLRNLDSIFMQDYKNYHVVYLDDNSPQKTGEYVKQYVKNKKIPEQKIKIIINQENKKAMKNIYEGVHQHCPDGEIVIIIDGDDSFLGRLVLKLYNAIFQQKKIAFLYSNFLKITSNSRTQYGFGSEVSQEYYKAGNLRNYWPLIGTHLFGFYSNLFKKVKKEDFCFQNGTFIDYAYDRAIFTPLTEIAFPRVYYLPEMVYEYRNDTGVNDGGSDWSRVSSIIRQKPAYEQQHSFPYIDQNPIIKSLK